MTRTFIVYGQGLIKAHPYIYKMITALEQNQFKGFHWLLGLFFNRLIVNFMISFISSLTRGWLFLFPFSKEYRYLQKLSWSTRLFAFLSDLSLISFGGRLKTKGRLSGRFADILSYQYMVTALLWYWRQTGAGEQSWIQTKWGLEYCFAKIQESFLVLLNNYPHRWLRIALKPFYFLLRIHPIACPPLDVLGRTLVKQLLENEEFREKLCSNIYFPKDVQDQFQKLNKAYKLNLQENQNSGKDQKIKRTKA